MAIYSLHHQPIGKSTQALPHTSAAHVRYITRPSASSHIEAGRMPHKPHDAAAFMINAENADRKNARVSDKLMLALPRELDAEQRAELVRGFAEDVTQGRASWLAAFHDQGKDAQNPHVHLLIRDRDPATGKRVACLSDRGSTERLRAMWEDHANHALELAGRTERIDRRTLEAQGIERSPTVHEGPKAQQIERRGARPKSRLRSYRNRPGSRLPHRQVDYRGIDRGRSRPAYNREVRETPADYWQALDSDNQGRELEQLRAIHHRSELVIPFPARRSVPHRVADQHPVNPGVVCGDLPGAHFPECPRSGVLPLIPPARDGEKSAPQGIVRIAGHDKILEPTERAAEQPAKPVEQNVNHKSIIGNKILFRKGNVMSVDDEEKRRLISDLANARAREAKSGAARDNALEKGYMRPDLAVPSIDKFYKNKGPDGLKDKFREFAGPSEFGVKRGNPLTKEGRAKRTNANEARRDLPQLWDNHAQDLKNREASERAFKDKYGPQEGQDIPQGAPGGLPPRQGHQEPRGASSGPAPYTPQASPVHPAEGQQMRSPEDKKNNDARRQMQEKLAREQHPAYARSETQPQQQPSRQSPEDVRNSAAMREAHEKLARENHPAHAQKAAEPEQQPSNTSFTDKLRSPERGQERVGSFSEKLADMRNKPQPQQKKNYPERGREDEIER
ncbi:MobA/MobL family protein [Rhizobium leguminosarum]|uniref:MobA/MobL protein domain-containing protein n=1 Tax=Rhizobium leguminosarum TaxID=384 RepID=A0A7K3VD61_RHILE|nr:MobA/MobL family protein [Rhizobium leguminosarum]NEK15036.1 hypothetical protein [Rhizobium leguminosarum]